MSVIGWVVFMCWSFISRAGHRRPGCAAGLRPSAQVRFAMPAPRQNGCLRPSCPGLDARPSSRWPHSWGCAAYRSILMAFTPLAASCGRSRQGVQTGRLFERVIVLQCSAYIGSAPCKGSGRRGLPPGHSGRSTRRPDAPPHQMLYHATALPRVVSTHPRYWVTGRSRRRRGRSALPP